MRFDPTSRMSQSSQVRYKRVVLKLSGEVLREPGSNAMHKVVLVLR